MTKYTKEQKRRIRGMIEAFEGCKRYLCYSPAEYRGSSNKSWFICNAIMMWRLHRNCVHNDEEAANDAENLVQRALKKHITFGSWVDTNNPKRVFSEARIQHLRHKWLRQLINDCKKALGD